jgi:hypothetical protein
MKGFSLVIPALDAGIHANRSLQSMDCRVKPGNDGQPCKSGRAHQRLPALAMTVIASAAKQSRQ